MSSNLRPQGARLGYQSNLRDRYDELFACRRRHCPNTIRGRRSFCCASCWSELPTLTRRWLCLVASYLTQHPDDEEALRLRDEFVELAGTEWPALPEPRRLDEAGAA